MVKGMKYLLITLLEYHRVVKSNIEIVHILKIGKYDVREQMILAKSIIYFEKAPKQ